MKHMTFQCEEISTCLKEADVDENKRWK